MPTTMTKVESLQAEIDRLNELNQILLDQLFEHGQPCGPIEDYIEMSDGTHHDAYRIFGRNDYLEYINDKSSFSPHPDGALSKFQVICRKWLVRRDLSPDIFEADTEEEEEEEVKNIKAPTYIPTGPFTLIKAFCGFDPLYRHKKISGFIREAEKHAATWEGAYGNKYFMSCLDISTPSWQWHRKNLQLIKYEEIINPTESVIYIKGDLAQDLSWEAREIRSIHSGSHYRSRLMKLLYNYSGPATTVKQLKQYCRDNQIVGYSKLKKAELKQLIIKTPH